MSRFVGKEEAAVLGFTLHSFSGDLSSASYVDDNGIFLDIYKTKDGKMEARLSFMHKILTITTGTFSFPHQNFDKVFYKQILNVYHSLDG